MVNLRIEYPVLLQAIENDQVRAVAIRGTSLVGLYNDSTTAITDFPDSKYDFETTIGDDFIETVRQITSTQIGKPLDEVSVSDFSFTVQYRAPVVTPWYIDFLPLLFIVALSMGLWYFLIMRQGGGNSKVMNFGKSRARYERSFTKVKVTFKDVAGARRKRRKSLRRWSISSRTRKHICRNGRADTQGRAARRPSRNR